MKYLKLLRTNHWVKNFFLLLPAFFSGDLFGKISEDLILGFFLFSFVASSIYVLNDLKDKENDALHPEKRFRPLAAGTVSVTVALTVAVGLLLVALGGSFLLNKFFFLLLASYFILNLVYSFGVKNIPIVDVVCIAIGFVIRIEAGSVLANVPLSMWLKLMVFLLALFMALGKRRDDVLLNSESGIELRKSLRGYNKEFLNISISLISAVILVCYIMYTVSPEVISRLKSAHLYYTCLFVFMGILRYLQLIFVKNDSGNPTKILLKDRFLQITLVFWILSFYIVIYNGELTF